MRFFAGGQLVRAGVKTAPKGQFHFSKKYLPITGNFPSAFLKRDHREDCTYGHRIHQCKGDNGSV